MFNRITGSSSHLKFLIPNSVLAHSKSCPASKKRPASPDSGGGSSGSLKLPDFKRADKTGPCRFAFVPEEWFAFFYPITGVSGPYLLGMNFINYIVSKELFVMEHEYYVGLSIFVIICGVVSNAGAVVGESLDKEVDAIVADWEKGRQDDRSGHESLIAAAKDAQQKAEGQKMLMDAKKENIAMQLEAVYRERMMVVYKNVTGRMDYHVKRTRTENKIHQKWMIAWILDNVRKSITPEFERQALDSAIQDLAAAASKSS